MKAYKDFIVSPIGERYNNSKKVGDKDLILNTEIFNHQYVNRLAKVIATPLLFSSPINVGDEVIVHHNVFRRWHDVKGREKNSRSYLDDNRYLISEDQIFLYKQNAYKAMPGYSFVKPLKALNKFNIEKEKPLIGIVKYSDGTFSKEELVGFDPVSKYEYQRNEEEYNPSWAQSS